MSQALIELKRLLAGQTAISGKVLSLSNSMARVATAKGVIEVAFDGGIQSGDRVILKDGRAVRVQSVSDAPVYFV